MKKLFSFDVTLKNLESLNKDGPEKVQILMEILKTFWFEFSGGSHPDYWDKVRVGSIDVFIDDEGHLHMDFVARFTLQNHPKLLEVFGALQD